MRASVVTSTRTGSVLWGRDCSSQKMDVLNVTVMRWNINTINTILLIIDSQGWLRYEGRCYQEFTPAFCGENEVLNLGSKRFKGVILSTGGQNYTCVSNPCNSTQLAHR